MPCAPWWGSLGSRCSAQKKRYCDSLHGRLQRRLFRHFAARLYGGSQFGAKEWCWALSHGSWWVVMSRPISSSAQSPMILYQACPAQRLMTAIPIGQPWPTSRRILSKAGISSLSAYLCTKHLWYVYPDHRCTERGIIKSVWLAICRQTYLR